MFLLWLINNYTPVVYDNEYFFARICSSIIAVSVGKLHGSVYESKRNT